MHGTRGTDALRRIHTSSGSEGVNNGVTMACFCVSGSRPCRKDALIILVMKGNIESISCWRRKVGIRSSEQDLIGDFMMRRRISGSIHERKDDSVECAVSWTEGDGWLAVDARTSSTFLRKKAVNPSAVWPVVPDTSRSRPSMDDNDLHRAEDERPCCDRRSIHTYIHTYRAIYMAHCVDSTRRIRGAGGSR